MRAKAQALNQFLRSMQGPGRAYTLLQPAHAQLLRGSGGAKSPLRLPPG